MGEYIKLNNPNCRIDFNKMRRKTNPVSLEEALSKVEPFELSDDVLAGKAKLVVDVPENWRELIYNHV